MQIQLNVEKVRENSWRYYDAKTITSMLELMEGVEWSVPEWDESCPIRKAKKEAFDITESMRPVPEGDKKARKAFDRAWKKWCDLPNGTVLSYNINLESSAFKRVVDFLFKYKISFEVINYSFTDEEEMDNEIDAHKNSLLWSKKMEKIENMYNEDEPETEGGA